MSARIALPAPYTVYLQNDCFFLGWQWDHALLLIGGVYSQELMSHPKGGEGAFNYVVTASSKVLAVL